MRRVIVQFFKGRSQGVKGGLGESKPRDKKTRGAEQCNHKRDGDGCKGERMDIVCRSTKNGRFMKANDDDEVRS